MEVVFLKKKKFHYYNKDCLETSNLVIIDGSLALDDADLCSEDMIDYSLVNESKEDEYNSVDNVESNEDVFICNFCGKKYIDKQKLSKHIRDSHTYQKKCSHCDKTFSRPYALSRHLQTHSTDNFECGICKVKIRRKDNFKQHLLLHDRDSKFQCKICNKSFSNNGNLSIHEKSHSKVKFVCPLCDKSYSYKTNLTRHKCPKK